MRVASIDIGTNTVLLLIADIDGSLAVVHEEGRIPRLGRDVDREGRIQISAFDKLAWILTEYRNVAVQFRVEKLIACATSAVRDAANREEFIRYLARASGIQVEVLSGVQEARWSFLGATSNFGRPAAVIDVGGGSTEITVPAAAGKLRHLSLQIGSVRLTERHFRHQPPLPEEIRRASADIAAESSKLGDVRPGDLTLIGIAGTATTLACLDSGLKEFDRLRVDGYELSWEAIGRWLQRLSQMTPQEILLLTEVARGREDILTAGVLILHDMMKLMGSSSLRVSERGLRHGLILREREEPTGVSRSA